MWRSTSDGRLRKYDFTYDAANRLSTADFNQLNSNSFSKAAGFDFSVSGMSYDANGNILTMNQKGWKLGGSETIDSLLYTYITNSNKLLNVWDRANDTATKLGDFRSSKAYMTALSNSKNTSATDYAYDGNGSLSLDKNKDISSIIYNHLNLPDSIRIAGKGTIKYTYDATGNKLKKVTVDSTGSPVKSTTTLYLMGNYVNDTLQFIGTEEGRARIKADSSAIVYDYMVKDHLGNVRMLLTEEKDTAAYPAATMETANATVEETYYSNLPITRVSVPSNYGGGYPQKAASLRGTTASPGTTDVICVGPAMILKVMAGDKFNVIVNSWWETQSRPSAPVSPYNQLIGALSSSISGIIGGHPSSTDLQSNTNLTGSVNTFLNNQSYNNTKAKAYLNWILLDDNFNYVSSSSGYEQVDVANYYGTQSGTDLPVDKSGFLYIYVSNASPSIDVYFDNLQVTHMKSKILEETHYYPFGLTMAGISSKALNFGGAQNKKKFNGVELQNKEFSDGSGLELVDMDFRNYDAQTGKFLGIDLLAELTPNWSPYAFAQNNPISYSDPNGLDTTVGGKPKPNPDPGDVWINKKGRTSIYDEDRGWANVPEMENVTVGGKSSSNSSSAVGWLTLFDESYAHSGQLQRQIKLLEKNGQFEAWFKGELKTWKLGYKGSGSVPSSLVNIQKENFFSIVRTNRKLLEYLKRTGLVLDGADLLLTGINIYNNGLNQENGTDLVFNVIAFIPGGGWIVSGAYFLGKESGVIDFDHKPVFKDIFGNIDRKHFMNTISGVSR